MEREHQLFTTKNEFEESLTRGLEISPIHEVMIDKAMMGWKEYELGVIKRLKMTMSLLFVLLKIWIQWEFILEIQ